MARKICAYLILGGFADSVTINAIRNPVDISGRPVVLEDGGAAVGPWVYYFESLRQEGRAVPLDAESWAMQGRADGPTRELLRLRLTRPGVDGAVAAGEGELGAVETLRTAPMPPAVPVTVEVLAGKQASCDHCVSHNCVQWWRRTGNMMLPSRRHEPHVRGV